jgi:hypothetical protein
VGEMGSGLNTRSLSIEASPRLIARPHGLLAAGAAG